MAWEQTQIILLSSSQPLGNKPYGRRSADSPPLWSRRTGYKCGIQILCSIGFQAIFLTSVALYPGGFAWGALESPFLIVSIYHPIVQVCDFSAISTWSFNTNAKIDIPKSNVTPISYPIWKSPMILCPLPIRWGGSKRPTSRHKISLSRLICCRIPSVASIRFTDT